MFSWVLGLNVWKTILVIRGWANKSQRVTKISIKIMRFLEFLFTLNLVFKHKGVFSNQHFCTNDLGKIWDGYIFHFSRKVYPLIFWNCLIFFSNDKCRVNQPTFVTSQNCQNICQTHQYYSFLENYFLEQSFHIDIRLV